MAKNDFKTELWLYKRTYFLILREVVLILCIKVFFIYGSGLDIGVIVMSLNVMRIISLVLDAQDIVCFLLFITFSLRHAFIQMFTCYP